MEKFDMKFIKIADEIFREACRNINMKNRPSLFIMVKDLKNGESDMDVIPVHDPALRKDAGKFVSIISYKNKMDLILFIWETENTLYMSYTEPDGKRALKVGAKYNKPDGIYVGDSTWEFNSPFEQYVSAWNEENSLFIEQMIKDNPPPNPMEDSGIMDIVGDVLKSLASTNCQCENCKRGRGELVESGDSVRGNFDNILNKLEIPNDKNKIN